MERLDDFMLFAEVVRETGFAAAARSLGIQRSKLSRRVADLERRLGVRLLQRNTRRVSLTTAGARIYQHARVIADEARAASRVAAELHGEPRGTLRLTCPASLAPTVLVPLVSEFCDLYPEVDILVDTHFFRPDIVGEGFELAFRVQTAPLEDSSLVAREICEVDRMIAVSSRLLAHTGPLQHPEQLHRIKLLAEASQGGLKSIQFLDTERRTYALEYTPHLASCNVDVLQAAAIAGMGATCLPNFLCAETLRVGKLVDAIAADSNWHPAPAKMYALMPARVGATLTARKFLDFVTPRLADTMSVKPRNSLVNDPQAEEIDREDSYC